MDEEDISHFTVGHCEKQSTYLLVHLKRDFSISSVDWDRTVSVCSKPDVLILVSIGNINEDRLKIEPPSEKWRVTFSYKQA